MKKNNLITEKLCKTKSQLIIKSNKKEWLYFVLSVLIHTFIFTFPVYSEEMTNQSIITEIYKKKTILTAGWGTNAGEFGRTSLPWGEQEDLPVEPDYGDFVVDSKGNIYILDTVNNRIQKFNNDGKYLKSISVPAWQGYTYYNIHTTPYTLCDRARAIAIEIDCEDNIYYHYVKNLYKSKTEVDINKDGRVDFKDISKEIHPGIYSNPDFRLLSDPETKGEIWQFKDDLLIKKWEVPYGFNLDIWVDEEDRKKYKLKINHLEGNKFKVTATFTNKDIKIRRILSNINIEEGRPEIHIKASFQKNEAYLDFMTKDYIVYTMIFDIDTGELKSVLRKGVIWHFDGNGYHLEKTWKGISIDKLERVPINR